MTDLKREKLVVIKLQYEGLHHWKDCNIPEVSFLKDKHRHIFYIELHKKVSHNDRDIEIIMLKREVLRYLENSFKNDFGTFSCEDIAEVLLDTFKCQFVQVLEDNENGAIIKL